jgi:hypothetical protein
MGVQEHVYVSQLEQAALFQCASQLEHEDLFQWETKNRFMSLNLNTQPCFNGRART